MSSDYSIHHLSNELIFIQWHRTASFSSEDAFLKAIRVLLEEAPQPLYFLSDLRKGRITTVRTLQRLSELTKHSNWAGSTAFSQQPSTKMLIGSFQKFAQRSTSKNEQHETLEEALAFLESLKEELTQGIDWAKYLGN
jgi:hypothetical protein